MKLYLSSYKLGDNPERLAQLIGKNKKAAIIPNALDFSTDLERRRESIQNNIQELQSLGLEPEELDLREYFGKTDELSAKIQEYGVLWVRGGNTFVLRRAMKDSGFDELISELKNQDEIVYGGYSAGICVLAPTLHGLHLVDNQTDVAAAYGSEVIWDGLDLIPYSIAPHYKSDHPEAGDVDTVVRYFIENNIPHKTLRDGEVIIADIKKE